MSGFGMMTDSSNRNNGIDWTKMALYGTAATVATGATIHASRKVRGSAAYNKGKAMAMSGYQTGKGWAKGAYGWARGEEGWKGRGRQALSLGGGLGGVGWGGAQDPEGNLIGGPRRGTPKARVSQMRESGRGVTGYIGGLFTDPAKRRAALAEGAGSSAAYSQQIGTAMADRKDWKGSLARGANLGIGWLTAADYAGQNWMRAGAVGTRAVMAGAAYKGASAGLDWAFN